MVLEIQLYGKAVLRERARKVGKITAKLRTLAQDMLDTMYDAAGVGLAAQQVGRTEAICVLDIPPTHDVEEEGGPRLHPDVPMPLVLIDPEILSQSGGQTGTEGCLSFPDIQLQVQRAYEITVRYRDLEGQDRLLLARDFLARALQHEIDHLNGVLFIDRVPPIRKVGVAGRLKRLKRETEAQQAEV